MQNNKHASCISVVAGFPSSSSALLSVSVLSLSVSLDSSAPFTVNLANRASSGHCFRKTHNYALKHNFVEVSWTRQPSTIESSESGKYSINSEDLDGTIDVKESD